MSQATWAAYPTVQRCLIPPPSCPPPGVPPPDPGSGHPRAHQPPLGRGTSPPAWDGRLDAPGQRRRHLPSSAWTRRREVKQGKSGGSVGTTDQGKGKGRSVVRPMGTVAYRGKGQGKGKGRGEGRLGQGGRGRSKGGEKLMGTTAYGGKGSKGRAANGDRPVGAASCRRDHHTMASCQNPPPGPPKVLQRSWVPIFEEAVPPQCWTLLCACLTVYHAPVIIPQGWYTSLWPCFPIPKVANNCSEGGGRWWCGV